MALNRPVTNPHLASAGCGHSPFYFFRFTKKEPTMDANLSNIISAAQLEDLKALAVAGGPNKHDAVMLVIIACIGDGWNTRSAILRTLAAVGYKKGHAAILLDQGTGPNPRRHHWLLDEEGRYHLHEEEGQV
jgi:hypothetical protein